MIKPLFEEMDAQTPKNSLPATSAYRQETWAQDTLKAENKLLDEVKEDTKATDEISTPTAEEHFPKVTYIGHRHNFYKIPTHINGVKAHLVFAKDSSGNWIVMGFSLIKCIGYANGGFSIFETSPGYLALSTIKVCREVYDVAGENCSKSKIALKFEDVAPVLIQASNSFLKPMHKENSAKLISFWREVILPKIQSNNLESLFEKPQPQPKPSNAELLSEKEGWTAGKIINEFCGSDIKAVLTSIESTTKKFKRCGLNGNSLITAIKFVADEEEIDPAPIINFVNFVKSETDEKIIHDGQQCCADVEYIAALIRISSEVGEGAKAKVLMHEIFHAILVERGMNTESQNEALVEELASGTVNLIRNNPALMEFIIGA